MWRTYTSHKEDTWKSHRQPLSYLHIVFTFLPTEGSAFSYLLFIFRISRIGKISMYDMMTAISFEIQCQTKTPNISTLMRRVKSLLTLRWSATFLANLIVVTPGGSASLPPRWGAWYCRGGKPPSMNWCQCTRSKEAWRLMKKTQMSEDKWRRPWRRLMKKTSEQFIQSHQQSTLGRGQTLIPQNLTPHWK